MWRIMKAKLQCRLHWIRENMTVLDTWRLCKVLNIIFLVILGPTVSTNTYLPYKGSALPPLFTATPLPTLISYGQTPPPFYFHIIYLFLNPYLIMNHQNHPVDCGPSLLFSVPLPPSSFPPSLRPSIHPTSLSFFLLSAKMLVLAGPSTFWVWTKTGQNLVLGWCTFKYLPCIIPSPYLSFHLVVTPGADLF